jgi:hypothetical protein
MKLQPGGVRGAVPGSGLDGEPGVPVVGVVAGVVAVAVVPPLVVVDGWMVDVVQ